MANKEDLTRLKQGLVDILTKAGQSVASGVTYVCAWAKTRITERQAGETIRRTRQGIMTRLRSTPWLEFARRYRWPLVVGLGALLLLVVLWLAVWEFPQWYVATWELKEPTDIATLESDTRTMMVQVVGGLLVLVGLLFAWRNLRFLAVERFVRLRERAISREHVDRQRRVAALLLHLEDLALTTGALDYSPDIALYLNNYQWVGRFVKEGLISDEFALATYGRNLLMLYPKLKPYIDNERVRRQYPTLWRDVDWLYDRFKGLNPIHVDNSVVRRDMEHWVNPTTRLTMGYSVDVAGLVTGKQGLTHFNLQGKDGDIYYAHYYRFPGSPQDPNRRNLNFPQLKALRSQIQELARRVFPKYSREGIADLVKKFDTFSTFALIYDFDRRLVAFNIYKIAEVVSNIGPVKTIYVEHAGTDPAVQCLGITQAVRNELYRQENPAVICGSSANGAIYVVNKHIAKTRRMVLYPTGPTTPATIVELANQIHDSLDLRNAELDDRLVRTYKTPVSKGDMVHPLEDSLPLCPNQHVFYMLLERNLDQALLRGQMR